MSIRSILDGIGQDPRTTRAMAFDRLARDGGLVRRRGPVLFHSTFDDGFDGWRDHYGAFEPRPPIGLTSYPVMAGKHALKISTGDVPYRANAISNGSGTYKNLSQYHGVSGLVSLSAWLCVGSGVDSYAWGNFGLGFDIQKWDNSTRGFFKATCVNPSTGEDDRRWVLTNDSDSYVTIPNSGDSVGVTSGQNENKFNFDYVRLTVDLAAASGLGGYHELQVNNRVFDLRGLGAGRGAQTPQAGTPSADYRGGFNAGLFLARSGKYPERYPSWLVADEIVCTVDDERAA
ncbi:hypothetical protein SEA_ANGELIQUE_31 [Gordonia phage Angelique]|nr:hypothetical protein SEA_ANGELIQUE_31 [Gordonia phage Angelique]